MMGIFRELGEGLAISQESPFLAVVGLVVASVFAVHWIRKNAAPRLREQKRARTFGRILETARGLDELAGMHNLTEAQRASFKAALIEHGEGLAIPKAVTSPDPGAQDEPGAEPKQPPPPWFLDRVERLVDMGTRLLAALVAIGLGVGGIFVVYDVVAKGLDAETAFFGSLFSLAGVALIVVGFRVLAKQVGIELGFIDDAKAFLRAKLTPPDWVYVFFGLGLLSVPYVLPIGFFAYMAHWCLTTSANVSPAEWILTAVSGLVAVGTTVKAAQKLRAFFYFPEDASPPAQVSNAS